MDEVKKCYNEEKLSGKDVAKILKEHENKK